jgi:S1-C subfamily serine protease
MDETDPTADRRSRRWFLGAVATAAAAGLAGCSSAPTATDGDPDTDAAGDGDGDAGSDGGAGVGDGGSGGFETVADVNESPYTEVYRQTIDSVVLVRVTSAGGGGQGSGFVWDDRHVVTNQHVVEGAENIDVRFSDGDWRTGTVVGTDVYSDLAVVRVDDKPGYATPLELVPEEPPIGTRVVALGNPFGLGGSVSEGIVSGVDRSLPAPNNFNIPDAIQTDAAVNPGNSGGPLVTLRGRVVGVINSGGGDNIGFAISAALMERVIPSLIGTGDYEHAYMGVRLLGVTPAIAEAMDLDEVGGVHITQVRPGGPSDGVLRGATDTAFVNGQSVDVGGDVVVRMGDRAIETTNDLSTFLALETSPGDTIPVEVIRDGERANVRLTLGSRPDP